MIYKINLDKKKEFEKWNFKQILKRYLPFIIPLILAMSFALEYMLTGDGDSSLPFSYVVGIIVLSNAVFFIIFLSTMFLSIKMISSTLKTWELDIEENYAVLKNSTATTTVNFADIKRFKESNDCITFYFKGIRRFYINWNYFYDSEKLKSELKNIANKIGTFTKESVSIETPKTKVKFNLVFYIILGIICILNMLIKILK